MPLLDAIEISAKARGRQAEPDDPQLGWIIASQNGDTVAFNRLILRWQSSIYNLNLRMLGDPEDAADVTQETFLRAYKSIRRFRLEARFSTWLYRIATNQCLTRLERGSRANQESLEQLQENRSMVPVALQSEGDQEASLFAQERQRHIREAVMSLPIEQRLTIELKFFQERTFEETADILGASPSTIKSRFYVGLEALKKRLVRGAFGEGAI